MTRLLALTTYCVSSHIFSSPFLNLSQRSVKSFATSSGKTVFTRQRATKAEAVGEHREARDKIRNSTAHITPSTNNDGPSSV